jgi:hypothetical protein
VYAWPMIWTKSKRPSLPLMTLMTRFTNKLSCGQVKIVNFGENIHGHLITPRHF